MRKHTMNLLVLTLTCIICCTSSIPVIADYDKEITFRGLPIGSSIEEVRNKLIEDGIERQEIQFSEGVVEGFFSNSYKRKYEYIVSYEGGYDGTIYDTGNLKLAGYEISFLSIDFMYKIIDGVLVKSQESVGLTRASYAIETKDQFAVYDDLKQKLTTLYGTPVESRYASNFSNADTEIKDIAIWYGANDTAVYITREWTTQDDGVTKIQTDDSLQDMVFVVYGNPNTYDDLKLILNYEEQLAYEAEQKLIQDSTDDTTGL